MVYQVLGVGVTDILLNKPKSGSVLCEKNTDEQGEQSNQRMLSAKGEKSNIIVRIGKIRLLMHVICAL